MVFNLEHEIVQFSLPDYDHIEKRVGENAALEKKARQAALLERQYYGSFFHDQLISPKSDELSDKAVQTILRLLHRTTPDWLEIEQKICETQEQILQASELLLIAKGCGLGDELQSAKFANAIAVVTGKPVRCLVSTQIKNVTQSTAQVQFIDQVDPQALLQEKGVFLLHLNFHVTPQIVLGEKNYEMLLNQGKILTFAISERTDFQQRREIIRSLSYYIAHDLGEKPNTVDLLGLAMFEGMGMHLQSKDLFVPILEKNESKEEIYRPGILIMPDAATNTLKGERTSLRRPEFANETGNVKEVQDSVKLLPIIVWREWFAAMVKQFDPGAVTIVIGTAHTAHSIEVLIAAEAILGEAGWKVMSWKGSLPKLRNLITQAEGVLTMDSVTAHKTSFVIKELLRNNLPAPKLLEIFNGTEFPETDYAVRGIPEENAQILHLVSHYHEKGTPDTMMAVEVPLLMEAAKWLFSAS